MSWKGHRYEHGLCAKGVKVTSKIGFRTSDISALSKKKTNNLNIANDIEEKLMREIRKVYKLPNGSWISLELYEREYSDFTNTISQVISFTVLDKNNNSIMAGYGTVGIKPITMRIHHDELLFNGTMKHISVDISSIEGKSL